MATERAARPAAAEIDSIPSPSLTRMYTEITIGRIGRIGREVKKWQFCVVFRVQ